MKDSLEGTGIQILNMTIKSADHSYASTRQTSIFFYAFLAFFISDITRVQELYPFLASLFFQKILGLISIAAILFDPMVKANLIDRVKTSPNKAIFFLFLWVIISMPLSIYPGNSFRFLTQYFSKTILIYVLIVTYGSSYQLLKRILWAYILAVGLLGVIYYASPGAGRIEITQTYDANDLAFVTVIAYAISFFKLFSLKGMKKLLVGVLCILFLITVIRTESRGGFLGLLAVTGIILMQLKRLGFRYMIIGLFLCLMGASIVFYYSGSEFWNRMSGIWYYKGDYNYTEASGRIAIWKRGVDIMITNPMFGVGLNNFYTAEGYSHINVGGKWSASHNSFLEIGAELGFPGLMCFCYIILSSLIGLKKLSMSDHYTLVRYSVVSSWIGFIVMGFFLDQAYSLIFYFLVGVSCALRNLKPEDVLNLKEIRY